MAAPRSVFDLDRNDIPAALAWLESVDWAPSPDALTVLLRLQDDSGDALFDEIERQGKALR